MKKKKKALLGFALLLSSLIVLTGCQNVKMWFKDFEQSFKGLNMTIRTFDDDSQIIDEISGSQCQ